MAPPPNTRNAVSFGHQAPESPNKKDDDAQSMKSESVQKLEKNVMIYRENLQTATQNQIDQLHQMNLNELESLTMKIKQQMATLNEKEEEAPGFGHKTFKTDVQRQHMTE